MTSNYHNVKRRYFANLGISPPASSSYPPSPFQPSPPATPFSSFQPIPQSRPSPTASPRDDHSSDSDLDLSMEESSSFEMDMDMDNIFEIELTVPVPSPPHPEASKCISGGHRMQSLSKSQSSPQTIPRSPERSTPPEEPVGVRSPDFIPPHLLTTRSGFSFFEYERTRRAAKKAY